MAIKSNNPSAIIWFRLRKNISAITGLGIILLAAFISIFCYVIMPDNTPNANEMNLSVATLKPGTEVTLIKTPLKTTIASQSFFERIFMGFNAEYKYIPVDSFWISNNKVYYHEYDSFLSEDEITLSKNLTSLFTGTENYRVEKGIVYWTDKDDIERSEVESNIQSLFLSERIVNRTYFMGTDRFGRDLFSRILAGTRISMAVGLIAVVISLFIGIILGAMAGFFRGKIDDVIVWLINVVWSIPTLLLVIAITLALGKGFTQVFIAVGLTMWVEVARVVRGQIFSLREKEFVEAGKALGFTNSRIIFRHIIPNIISPVIVIAASNFASAILLEAGLSFLGMGAQPPTPSWGMMIKENYAYIIVDAAYLAIFPGLAIMVMVLAFTWLGNGLRDALDAKEGSGSKV